MYSRIPLRTDSARKWKMHVEMPKSTQRGKLKPIAIANPAANCLAKSTKPGFLLRMLHTCKYHVNMTAMRLP